MSHPGLASNHPSPYTMHILRRLNARLLAALAACAIGAALIPAPAFADNVGTVPSPVQGKDARRAPYVTKLGPPIPVAAIRKVTAVEGITEYRLPNGLKVLLFPDPSKPTITVNITYRVGSRYENYGETGMAHLLEHMMFKGTPKHPRIGEEFNARGVRFNGTTWLDRTNYYDLFQASDDNLAWAIGLEADRMVNSYIARSDLDSEMTVVRNEFEEGENSPFSVLVKRMQSIAYDWHAYGRSTIGNRSDIENVKIGNLQAFYRLYYQPDNAVLLVAGKFDPGKALALIAQDFGPIPKPAAARPVFWTVEPTQDGPREFQVRRKGDIQIVLMAYHVPSELHADSDALAFASYILGDVPTGRLHKEIVEKGLAAQVFAYPLVGHDPGLQMFGAVLKNGQPVEPAREALVRVVEGFGAAPPTKQEMDRARLAFANSFDKTLANHESVGVELSESIALGDWRLFFLSRERIDQVKPEDVARVSKAYFRRDNRTTGLFVPDDASAARRDPGRPADRAGDGGLQAEGADEPRGGLRSFAGEHRCAHEDPRLRAREGGPAREEEPRRDGERRDPPAPRQREGALRAADERRDGGAHARARHREPHARGALRRARAAQVLGQHLGAVGRLPDHAAEPRGGLEARGRCVRAPALRSEGVRAAA